MKVYNLTSRKVEDYDDGYAARLIEQGKAILPKEKATAEKSDSFNQPDPSAPNGADNFADSKATLPKEKAAKTEETPKAAKAGKAGGK